MNFKNSTLTATCFVCSLALSTAYVPTHCRAEWPGFRNDGSSQTNALLPLNWSPDTSISWQNELPGYGQSCPVILKDKVFVTSVAGTMKETLLISCFDISDGSLVWTYEHPSSSPSPSSYMFSRAAPTPNVDARGIYAFFESGDFLAVDLQGKLIWHLDLPAKKGPFESNHGLGSSPAQNDSHVFLNLEHKGPSYLLAIDKTDGNIAWQADRPSGSSWSSPVVAQTNRGEQVLVSSGGKVSGYSSSEGKLLWEIEGVEGNTVPSPTLEGSLLYVGARLPEFANEGSFESNCCIDLASDSGAHPQIRWRAAKALCDYASPIVCDGRVYLVNKVGVLNCLDAETGELCYRSRLGTQCWASPIVSEDRIYFFGKDGKTVVVRSGPEFEVIATNQLWDELAPPKPETYVEHSGGNAPHGPPAAEGENRPEPGGGMLAALMKGDADNDGVLQESEIPDDFRPMLGRIDTNGDGSLDSEEMQAMVASFAARRADSRESARDPIVYGAAATGEHVIVRTGTRLYAIR